MGAVVIDWFSRVLGVDFTTRGREKRSPRRGRPCRATSAGRFFYSGIRATSEPMVARSQSSTIFALSSGRPPAAIAVVRVCGPQAGLALRTLIGRVPAPRQASLGRVREPASGEVIDEA